MPVIPSAISEYWNIIPGTIHTHTNLNPNTGARCHA
jgi:hypothetical protein